MGRSQKVRANGVMREVRDSCYDISLLESLQALLKCGSMRDQVCYSLQMVCFTTSYLSKFLFQIFNSHSLHNEKMGDYCDGSQFKDHPLFKNDPIAFQIRLYYDDLEICNALGSKTKKHKLGKCAHACMQLLLMLPIRLLYNVMSRTFLLHHWEC